MKVWDAGVVSKNRYGPLVWSCLEECSSPLSLFSQDGYGKEAVEAPTTFKLISNIKFSKFGISL